MIAHARPVLLWARMQRAPDGTLSSGTPDWRPATRSNRLHLPAIYQWPELAELGGFAGYGPRLAGVIHAAMQIVDRILRGAHPTDIPVQQPTTFALVINLKTATALGLTVPQSILARADEVIE